MRKSFTKRFRQTKTGKLMRRTMAQDHFRANKSGNQIRNKRGTSIIKAVDMKAFLQFKNKGRID